jgi:hypothetical protein
MQFNCPVCNKAGLPDYRATQTICPQCNSDLKPFLLIHSISKKTTSKVGKFACCLGVLLVAVLRSNSILQFSYLNEEQIISESSNTIIQLRRFNQYTTNNLLQIPQLVAIRKQIFSKRNYPYNTK